MPMPMFNDDDIIRILAAGGGMKLKTAFKPVDTLVRFAATAGSAKSRLVFEVTTIMSANDYVRIAAAGGGSVSFEWP